MDEKEKAIILAEKIKLLFSFCGDLIADKHLLGKTMLSCSDNDQTVMVMAPIFGAMGIDWEEKELQSKIRTKRAEALYNLIDILDTTEKERKEFYEKQEKRLENRKELLQALGL